MWCRLGTRAACREQEQAGGGWKGSVRVRKIAKRLHECREIHNQPHLWRWRHPFRHGQRYVSEHVVFGLGFGTCLLCLGSGRVTESSWVWVLGAGTCGLSVFPVSDFSRIKLTCICPSPVHLNLYIYTWAWLFMGDEKSSDWSQGHQAARFQGPRKSCQFPIAMEVEGLPVQRYRKTRQHRG